jgi:hypothetical protein
MTQDWRDDRLVLRRPEARNSVVAGCYVPGVDRVALAKTLADTIRHRRAMTDEERAAQIAELACAEEQAGEEVAVSDVLGYVVVEWHGDRPKLDGVGDELYEPTTFGLSVAHEAARMLAADGSGRYTVHAVMAEETEEDK